MYLPYSIFLLFFLTQRLVHLYNRYFYWEQLKWSAALFFLTTPTGMDNCCRRHYMIVFLWHPHQVLLFKTLTYNLIFESCPLLLQSTFITDPEEPGIPQWYVWITIPFHLRNTPPHSTLGLLFTACSHRFNHQVYLNIIIITNKDKDNVRLFNCFSLNPRFDFTQSTYRVPLLF